MKKLFTLFILVASCYYLKAQTVFLTEQNYQNLKQSGTLDSKVNYKFITPPNNSNNVNYSKTSLSTAKTSSSVACQCLIPIDPTFSVVPMQGFTPPNYRCDDGSSASIPLGFSFCFYGSNYSNCFINNNGNISFGTSYTNYSSNPFPNTNFVMIAPFWADADTRNTTSGLVYYKQTPTALIIKWSGIGYYNSHADKTNDFQLIITNGLDSLIPAGNNVSFCYGDMQWTTGDASMGVGGFPATSSNVVPATVGINYGDGIDYFQIGQFSAPGTGYNGPYNANDSVDVLDNMHFVFNTCNTNNLAPFTTANVCDTTIVSPFQIVTGEVYAYAPEINQSLTVNYSEQAFKTSTNAFSIVSTQTVQGGLIIHYQFDASQVAPGSRVAATITGNDSYSTAANYSRTLYFKVDNITGLTAKEVFEKPFLFPNPASEVLFLSNTTNSINIELYDVFGNIVIQKTFENYDEKSMSIDKLANGYYFAKLYSDKELIRTQKIIISN